jgi:hypothetical protein
MRMTTRTDEEVDKIGNAGELMPDARAATLMLVPR